MDIIKNVIIMLCPRIFIEKVFIIEVNTGLETALLFIPIELIAYIMVLTPFSWCFGGGGCFWFWRGCFVLFCFEAAPPLPIREKEYYSAILKKNELVH